MPSTSEPAGDLEREDLRIAWLAALAVTIHVAESALPSPLPGVKPGLANVVTIVTLAWFGWHACAWVSGLRVVAGSLLTGTFLSPTFLLAAAGAGAALLVLWPASRLPGRGFSPLGLSLLAAMGHMAGQFLLAWWLLIPHPALLGLLPPLMTAAVIFGIVSGIIALRIVEQGPPATPS
ncbi:MAG TPA: Gx transporter family protein [Thiotrichales bacterium]|nr:Gx transporter family protein [Thiotrichales bacterium]